MTPTSGGAGHGGKRENSGRKRTISDPRQYKKDCFERHKLYCFRMRKDIPVVAWCEIGGWILL